MDIELTHTEKRILLTLQRYWRFGNGGSCWYNFEELSIEINRCLNDTKRAVHSMRNKGIVKYTPLVDMEGRMHGSGYILSNKWDVE